MRTGDALEAYHRRYLDAAGLSGWAEALVLAGKESDAILKALATSEAHWKDVNRRFAQICADIGLSGDIDAEIEQVKHRICLDEYRRGLRSGAELLWKSTEIRDAIGFPEAVEFQLREDSDEGSNSSGFYGIQSQRTGDALESEIRNYLTRAGHNRDQP